MIQVIILIVGFIILIKGADIFVDGASSLAGNFNVSKMLVGLTIVAFGTSAPEFAVSVKAMFSNSGDIVLGNVIGSNIINIMLIIGITSVIKPIKVKSDTVKKEIPIVLLGSLMLASLIMDNLLDNGLSNVFSRGDGACIILFFGVFMYYLISVALRNKRELKTKEEAKYKLIPSIIYTIFGIAAIVIGSNVVVDSATIIATNLNISSRIIALTVIAFGTSLPELTTSVVASLKGESDIAIGNIIGSNIFNIGMVLGLPIFIFGSITASGFSGLDIIMLIVSAVMLFIFSYTKREISRKEGIIMLITFVLYYGYIILN